LVTFLLGFSAHDTFTPIFFTSTHLIIENGKMQLSLYDSLGLLLLPVFMR